MVERVDSAMAVVLGFVWSFLTAVTFDLLETVRDFLDNWQPALGHRFYLGLAVGCYGAVVLCVLGFLAFEPPKRRR